MKTRLLFVYLISFLCCHAWSQSNDYQWIINDSIGKTGVTGLINNFDAANTIATDFTLKNVISPNVAISGARNDLFIIYSDGTHFNSRNSTLTDPFYVGSSGTPTKSHRFSGLPGLNIEYAYLTNIYEGDDLPDLVAVSNGIIFGGPTIILDKTNASAMSANHEVVYSKDFTLILNLDSLSLEGTTDFLLDYSGVAEHPSGVPHSANILSLEPVFKSGAYYVPYYPNGTFTTVGDQIQISTAGTGRLRYINFRPTEEVLKWIPDSDEGRSYDAVFTILRGGEKHAELREPIRHSHDPNFVRVDSLCRKDDGDYVIYYHLEFENTGESAAIDFHVEVTFQDFFDLGCIQAYNWKAGGIDCDEAMLAIDGQNVKFDFNTLAQLAPGGSGDIPEAKGSVDFYVKVKSSHDASMFLNTLRFEETIIVFDAVKYPIMEFYDKIKGNGRPLQPTCETCTPCTFWTCIHPGIMAAIIAILIALIAMLLYKFSRRRP